MPGACVILGAGPRFAVVCAVLSPRWIGNYLPQPQEGATIVQQLLLQQRSRWQRGSRQQRSLQHLGCLQQRSLQHRGSRQQRSLQHFSRQQRGSRQQRCLQHLLQPLSQPQLGALASQVGATAAQVGAAQVGAAQLGAAFAQLSQPLLQQRVRQQRSLWQRSLQHRGSRQHLGAQHFGAQQVGAASQPHELPPPNRPAALTEEAIHNRPAAKAATITRFIAELLKTEHTETETETTCRRNRRPRDVLVGAAGRDADVQRPSATTLKLGVLSSPQFSTLDLSAEFP